MNIHAKFDGGKQYNRSQSRTWEGRCAGAGLRQNLGPEWGTIACEKVAGEETNAIFKKATLSDAKQLDCDRKHEATDEARKREWIQNFRRQTMTHFKHAETMLGVMVVLMSM